MPRKRDTTGFEGSGQQPSYQRHITPAAVPLDKVAIIEDVVAMVGDHKEECTAQQAEARRSQWQEITAIKLSLESISSRLRMAAWIVGLAVTLVGTVGIFVARYAIVGAITLELDKRLAPARPVSVQPFHVLPTAVAAEAQK